MTNIRVSQHDPESPSPGSILSRTGSARELRAGGRVSYLKVRYRGKMIIIVHSDRFFASAQLRLRMTNIRVSQHDPERSSSPIFAPLTIIG
jgi:hypothetical protein